MDTDRVPEGMLNGYGYSGAWATGTGTESGAILERFAKRQPGMFDTAFWEPDTRIDTYRRIYAYRYVYTDRFKNSNYV